MFLNSPMALPGQLFDKLLWSWSRAGATILAQVTIAKWEGLEVYVKQR